MKPVSQRDFFEACDLRALADARWWRCNCRPLVVSCGAGVQPCHAAPEHLHVKLVLAQILHVQIGDFQFVSC